jgi:hypothetical protein
MNHVFNGRNESCWLIISLNYCAPSQHQVTHHDKSWVIDPTLYNRKAIAVFSPYEATAKSIIFASARITFQIAPSYRRALTIESSTSLASACPKYSLILARAISKVAKSSIVLGTITSLSNSPRIAFSTISLSTRRSILPDRVFGIIHLPWMMPPKEAMAPT